MFNPLSRIDSEHRAVIYLVNQQPEFERLEELTADTIHSARRAVSEIESLPQELKKQLKTYIQMLGEAVETQRVLTDDFRHAASSILRALARVDADEVLHKDIDYISRLLRDALETSHRVADLLAAERDIDWQRRLTR